MPNKVDRLKIILWIHSYLGQSKHERHINQTWPDTHHNLHLPLAIILLLPGNNSSGLWDKVTHKLWYGPTPVFKSEQLSSLSPVQKSSHASRWKHSLLKPNTCEGEAPETLIITLRLKTASDTLSHTATTGVSGYMSKLPETPPSSWQGSQTGSHVSFLSSHDTFTHKFPVWPVMSLSNHVNISSDYPSFSKVVLSGCRTAQLFKIKIVICAFVKVQKGIKTKLEVLT